jgi:hypothetical protein
VKFIDEHKGHRVGDGLRWGVESICTVPSEHGAAIAPSTYYDARAHTPRAVLSSCWVSSVTRVSLGARVTPDPGWLCQLAVGRPMTSFQVAKREVISRRYSSALSP